MEKSKFSCVIIGGGTLPIHCAEILLNSGHEIRAIISSDAAVKRWTKEKNLSSLDPGENLSEELGGGQPFDYLFSIVNEHILREEVLRLPSKLAVNYHDAPLPKYAGTHATSWALINGETLHGITWHVITETVDAGDILKQQIVEINKNDTALTLNTKCYEAAINSFAELVDELSEEKFTLTKQNLEDRTFFARFKRPAHASVICWNNSAADISALVRALNFGLHPNPLGCPKIVLKDDFFIVSDLEVLDSVSLTPPGTINEIGEQFLRLSTADSEVILRKILTLDGQNISVSDLATMFHLSPGQQLTTLNSETIERLGELNASFCKHETYWVRKLSALETPVIPYSNSTISTREARYMNVPMRVPEDVLAYLEERSNEFKMDDFLLAAFGALLARLGGIDNFDVGYKNSETQIEITGLENFFAVHLPLRINADCSQGFSELYKNLKKQQESIKNHKSFCRDLVTRYPLLGAASDARNKVVFPVIIENVERYTDSEPLPGSHLTLIISKSEPVCHWIYNQDRFEDESITKLISHFTMLLKSIATRGADEKVASLPLLTGAEEHQLLIEWNRTQADFPKEMCIHQMVASRAAEFPNALAVACGEERLNYAELNSRSNQLAIRLRQMGVGPEVLVAVCLERSVETAVGLLGILKAGGAYVPLDPAYPAERLAFMLKDSGVQVLLTQQKLKHLFSGHKVDVLCFDSDWNTLAKESEENFETGVTTDNLAYVIYTSGSTGKPKGVELEHRGLLNLVSWHQRSYHITPADRATLLAGPAFDASVWELWTYLATGASVHIPDKETRASAPKLLEWLKQQEITVCFLPTPLAESVLEQQIPPELALRFLLTGGDRLHRQAISQKSLSFKLVNHYGPTENTVVTTCGEVEIGSESKIAPTIGRPMENVQIYLLDRYLQPVPVGIPGEIFIGGESLARGYHNRPDLTAERFINHSFGDGQELRLYKTGDLGRYLPDGNIDFLDRVDDQVKIRGFRIELGEIETVLLIHPAVREASVIARESEAGEKRLLAYIVGDQEQGAEINELRRYLKQKLPDYMVPSAFVALDYLPLTPNGKVDRNALPAPLVNLSDTENTFAPHRDTLEFQLIGIWETVLGVHPIGIQDDFFDLGGHSLQAVKMFVEVEKTFRKNIPLATLFEAGTIEKIADILRRDGWSAPESSLVPIQPDGTNPPFFCIHAKGGNVLFYRDLAKHLGTNQPFYGIQARRLGGRQVGHSTVEEMAEFYIQEIRNLQPKGPYFLGGSSFGGLAAFEIAQQLRAEGHEVALLALLDTGTPDYPRLLPGTNFLRSKAYELARRFQHHQNSLKMLNTQEKADYALSKVSKVWRKYYRKINNNYKKVVRKSFLKLKGNGSIPKNFIQIEDQIWRAGQKYQPREYPGKVTLFRAAHQPLGIYPDPTLGWGRFVSGELEIHEVPGHHGSVVAEPYVKSLAEELNRCIEKAQLKEDSTAGKLPVIETTEKKFAMTSGI